MGLKSSLSTEAGICIIVFAQSTHSPHHSALSFQAEDERQRDRWTETPCCLAIREYQSGPEYGFSWCYFLATGFILWLIGQKVGWLPGTCYNTGPGWGKGKLAAWAVGRVISWGNRAATGLVQEGYKAWALCLWAQQANSADSLRMWSVRQATGGSQQAVCDREENCHGTGSQWVTWNCEGEDPGLSEAPREGIGYQQFAHGHA